jgi:hypothetical protein
MPEVQVTGAVKGRSLYIARPEDEAAFRLLSKAEYCNILTSRQMGKTSLAYRLKRRLVKQKIRVALVDLSPLTQSETNQSGEFAVTRSSRSPTLLAKWRQQARAWFRRSEAANAAKRVLPVDAHVFYPSLLSLIAYELGLSVDAHAWWKKRAESEALGQRLQNFFDEILVVPGVKTVVFLDEVDTTINLPYTDALFTTIRALYNRRANDDDAQTDDDAYAGVAFCLMGVLTPDELIKDRSITSYNVGQTLELTDFNRDRDDLQPLVDELDAAGLRGAAVLTEILELTNGHPFLTMALASRCMERKRDNKPVTAKQLLEEEPTTTAPLFAVHFARIEELLTERLHQPGVALRLYRRVLSGKRIKDSRSKDVERLKLAGVVRRDGSGDLVIRNQIYAQRFGLKWLEQNMPPMVPAWMKTLLVGLGILLGLTVLLVLYLLAVRERNQSLVETNALQEAQAARENMSLLGAEPFTARYAGLSEAAKAKSKSLKHDYLKERARWFDQQAGIFERTNEPFVAMLLYGIAADRDASQLGSRDVLFDRFVTRSFPWRPQTIWLGDFERPIPRSGAPRPSRRCYSVKTAMQSTVVLCENDSYSITKHSSPAPLGVGELAAFALSPDGRWFLGLTGDSRLVWRDLEDPFEAQATQVARLATERPCVTTTSLEVESTGSGFRVLVGCDEGKLMGASLSQDWYEALEAEVAEQPANDRRTKAFKFLPLGRPVSDRHHYLPVAAVQPLGAGRYALATPEGVFAGRPASLRRVGPPEPANAFALREGKTLAVGYQAGIRLFEVPEVPSAPIADVVNTYFERLGPFVQVAFTAGGVCGIDLGEGTPDTLRCSAPHPPLEMTPLVPTERFDGLASTAEGALLLSTNGRVISLEVSNGKTEPSWENVQRATGLTLSRVEDSVRALRAAGKSAHSRDQILKAEKALELEDVRVTGDHEPAPTGP